MWKYNFKLSTTRDYRDCEDIKFLVALTEQNSKTFQAAVTPDIYREGGRRKLHIGATSSKTKLEKVWLPSKIVLNITQHFLNLPAYTIMFLTFIFQIQHRWERSLSICIKGDDPRVRILYLKCCMCWATTFQTSSNNVGFNNCWIQQCIMMWNLLLSVIQKYFSNEPKNQLAP